MSRNLADRGRGGMPLGIVGALALILTVESALLRRELEVINTNLFQYRATARAAGSGAARGAAVLGFGDSQVKMGFLPRLIGRRIGQPAYNLALCGGQVPVGYFLLRKALERGARPDAIVVGFSANIVQAGPLHYLGGYYETLAPRDIFDLAWKARDPGLFSALLVGSRLPSYRLRHELRAIVQGALHGTPPPVLATNQVHQRNWAANHGAQVEPAWPHANLAMPDALAAILYPKHWGCDRLNALYIVRFLALAEARGIAVHWVIPPIRPDVQARRETLGLDAEYGGFIRRLQTRFPRLVVIDGRHAGYTIADFVDPIHLNRRGAVAFSAGIAECLAGRSQSVDAPRWIELPELRERDEPGVLVEDLAESRLVLEVQATRRR